VPENADGASFCQFAQRQSFGVLWVQAERALFLASHKRSFCWMDEWHGLTMEQLRAMEKRNDQELNKVSGRLSKY
jgi:hypothetical protein